MCRAAMAMEKGEKQYSFDLGKFLYDEKYRDTVIASDVCVKQYLCGRGNHSEAGKSCPCYRAGFANAEVCMFDLCRFANETLESANRVQERMRKASAARIDGAKKRKERELLSQQSASTPKEDEMPALESNESILDPGFEDAHQL